MLQLIIYAFLSVAAIKLVTQIAARHSLRRGSQEGTVVECTLDYIFLNYRYLQLLIADKWVYAGPS